MTNRPDSIKSCSNFNCESKWFTDNWSDCSPKCKKEGFKTRIVYCRMFDSEKYYPVDDRYCKDQSKPNIYEKCSSFDNCYKWKESEWLNVSYLFKACYNIFKN